MTGRLRPGEVVLEGAPDPDGPRLRPIGRIRSPWGPGDCPRNIGRARETGRPARIDLDPAFAPALAGLQVGQPVILLYWMDRARRDLLVQAPRHVTEPRGTFALRSPNRPNTISQATVRITAIDPDSATIGIDAIDCFDNTPLLDIKPWLETVDLPPR
ncbi:TrmO family methyltransferase domain-containing protein [Rhodovulum marinum]|uniref:tRNA-Thr(GGU) m(6)t(6)A37 methyltransferase TsaA n=1 Tax=Rhodovulum marinum TaxID=320662 RepID=A0A4R2PZA7_9RHOB|nr:TrmO family methyltransferase [Rhodovulum marinum]TCP40578.1 tRNA-Thr(GGU) m(6)t(6)A37 methyltransferase TsaA [Rhodovulum marinum]